MTMSGSTNNTTSGPGSGNHGNSGPGGGGTKEEDSFVEVWAKNLEEEFAKIRQIVQKYPYVSMVREMEDWGCGPFKDFYIICLLNY